MQLISAKDILGSAEKIIDVMINDDGDTLEYPIVEGNIRKQIEDVHDTENKDNEIRFKAG
jgi:hypothetical protein